MRTKNLYRTYKLDEHKNAIPCSVEEWSDQLEEMLKNKTKHVSEETINDYWISTIWLGLDQNWNGGKFPLLYETMVFNKDHYEIYCDRYSTWQEAEEGHKKAVEWVKNGCKHEDEINETNNENQ